MSIHVLELNREGYMFHSPEHPRQMQKTNRVFQLTILSKEFLQGGCNLVLNSCSFNWGYQQGYQLVHTVVLHMMEKPNSQRTTWKCIAIMPFTFFPSTSTKISLYYEVREASKYFVENWIRALVLKIDRIKEGKLSHLFCLVTIST